MSALINYSGVVTQETLSSLIDPKETTSQPIHGELTGSAKLTAEKANNIRISISETGGALGKASVKGRTFKQVATDIFAYLFKLFKRTSNEKPSNEEHNPYLMQITKDGDMVVDKNAYKITDLGSVVV